MEQPQQQQQQQQQQQNPTDQTHKHKMDKLRDTILTQLTTLNPSKPITHSIKSLIEQRLQDIFPTLHTPTHHPYASMIRRAIMELNEEGGSSEEAISGFIKREYEGLPWGHASLLSHHLRRLCGNGEIVITGNRRYMILVEEEMWRRNEDRVESIREQEEEIGEGSPSIKEVNIEEQSEEEELKSEVFEQKIEAFETQGQLKQSSLRLRMRGPSKPESASGTTMEASLLFQHQNKQQQGRQTPPKSQTDVNTNIEVLMPSSPQNHNEQQAPKRRGRGRPPKLKPDAKPVVGVLMPSDYEQQPQGLKSNVDTTTGVSDHQHPSQLQQQQTQGRGRGRPPKAKGSTATSLEALLPSQHQGQQQKPQSRGRGKHPKQKSDEVTVNADLSTSRDKSSSHTASSGKRVIVLALQSAH